MTNTVINTYSRGYYCSVNISTNIRTNWTCSVCFDFVEKGQSFTKNSFDIVAKNGSSSISSRPS